MLISKRECQRSFSFERAGGERDCGRGVGRRLRLGGITLILYFGRVTAELTSPTVVAAWLRAAVEAPEGAAWLVSWV